MGTWARYELRSTRKYLRVLPSGAVECILFVKNEHMEIQIKSKEIPIIYLIFLKSTWKLTYAEKISLNW